MENESRFSQMLRSFSDKIQDQGWFQQLKAKWDELDARAKVALKYTLLLGSSVLTVGFVGTNLYDVAVKKHDIDERLALIGKIQSAQDELKRLKDVTSRLSGGNEQPWGEFLKAKAESSGFDSSIVQVVSEKIVSASAAPPSKDSRNTKDSKTPAPVPGITGPEETVVESAIKHVNVRQLIKFVHADRKSVV